MRRSERSGVENRRRRKCWVKTGSIVFPTKKGGKEMYPKSTVAHLLPPLHSSFHVLVLCLPPGEQLEPKKAEREVQERTGETERVAPQWF
jgi:hypothetical protein